MSIIILLIALLIIACPIALMYVNAQNDKNDEITKKLNTVGLIFLYGIIGGFSAYILYYILAIVIPINDEGGLILLGVVVICAFICGCSVWIVQTIKNKIE